MTRHHLNKLLIATAFVLVAAFWATSTRSPESNEESPGKPLVEGLAKDVNDITSIRLVEAGDQAAVTLMKGEDRWTVAERDHFPADVQKVREYLLKLADAKLAEAKTSKPESHAKLGVEDVAGKEAKGVRVELEGLKTPVRFVVGNANTLGQSGTFVRRNDEAQAWLATGSLIPDRQVGNWLDKNIMDVQSSRIERFELQKGGKTLAGAKTRPEDDKYTILDIPPGRELASKSDGHTPDPVSLVNATYRAFDGLVVTTTAWMEGEAGQARFVASLDEEKAKAHIASAQETAKAAYATAKAEYDAKRAEFDKKKAEDPKTSDADAPMEPAVPAAVADAVKDAAEQLDKLKQEVATINARCAGWDFRLPAYKFSSINKTMEDLLKAK